MDKFSQLSDEKIVQKVREQDQELFGVIIKRYQTKLVRYVYYLIYDEDKAVDAVQQAFIKAFTNLQNFNLNKKFSSWIYRIAHNEAMSIMRKTKNQVKFKDNFVIQDDINIEDAYIKEELIKDMHYCLDKIPLMYKEPLTLYYLENQSYDQISEILHLPINTVGIRIRRAKILLKSICQKRRA